MEPFEVMISESQERMLAIVEPGRWAAVAGRLRALGPAGAVIGRVTDDGRHRRLIEGGVARSTRTATCPARVSSPGSRPGPRPATRSFTSGVARRPPAAGPPRPRARPTALRTACRSAAWTRAPCCSALLGSPEPAHAAARSSSSTTRPSRRTRWRRPAAAPRSLRIKGTTKALVATDRCATTRRRARSVARRRDVRRRGDPQRRRSPARARWASPTA